MCSLPQWGNVVTLIKMITLPRQASGRSFLFLIAIHNIQDVGKPCVPVIQSIERLGRRRSSPCSRRWRLGSRRRRWPRGPSSTASRWRCSVAPPSDPAERWRQSPLRSTRVTSVSGGSGVREGPNDWRRTRSHVPSLTSAFSVSSTFCPLMSRWMTWWACRWAKPCRHVDDKLSATTVREVEGYSAKPGIWRTDWRWLACRGCLEFRK